MFDTGCPSLSIFIARQMNKTNNSSIKLLLALIAITAAVFVRTVVSYEMSLYYISNSHLPDASRISTRVSARLAGDLTQWIPSHIAREMPYYISGFNSYPPAHEVVIKYCLIDSVFLCAILIFFFNRISMLPQIRLGISVKAIVATYFMVYFSPGAIYLTFTFRSEWGSWIAISVLIWSLTTVQTSKTQFLPLTIAFSLPRLVSPFSLLLLSFVPRRKWWRISLGDLVVSYFKFVAICSVILAVATITLKNSFWSESYYLYTEYNGWRGQLNVSNILELPRLFPKVFFSYYLDWTRLDFLPTEDFNTVAALFRVISLTYCLLLSLGRSRIKKARNFLLLLYMVLTFPIIALTGFYQSRYFIVFDLFLFLRVALALCGTPNESYGPARLYHLRSIPFLNPNR